MHQVLLIISVTTSGSAIACFFVPIYCINHLLDSATPFSLVILLGSLSYQLPILGPSISVVIVSVTPLSYFYQHTVSAIK